MLILVSPAKTLDFDTPPSTASHTIPELLEHSRQLIEVCRELTPMAIASLMKVSDSIAGLNAARFEQWHPSFNLTNSKQAIFAFRGDVYTGLDADSLTEDELERAQSQLRILSGLYGLLKPLDLMQPYRLEMGTSLVNPKGKNLYAFWGDIITDKINEALLSQGDDIIVNLASNEYFKSVKPKLLQGTLITPVFKDRKGDEYKVISFFAKRARGMMARFILEKNIKTIEQLTSFDMAGYYYSEQLSTPNEPVFLREAQ